MSKKFWNERYASHDTVYGDRPNEFFHEQVEQISPGRLLLPAEGEGRNAVFAASLGWRVQAFDYSEEAMHKATSRADLKGVSIEYTIQEIESVKLPVVYYDAIGLIYIHLAPSLRKNFHQQCVAALKPSGRIVLEAFSKHQIRNTSGGPTDSTLLYSLDDLQADFRDLEIRILEEMHVVLNEGPFHQGPADVIRLVAVKN
jgi:SAM-dependent methyltransferase